MKQIREFMSMSKKKEEGATAVEYGIMVALIAAIIVLVVLYLGRQVKSGFCDTQDALQDGGATSQVAGASDDCA